MATSMVIMGCMLSGREPTRSPRASLSSGWSEFKMRIRTKIFRFEMPFNIWCGSNAEDPDPNVKGCRKHIGIGVRYNAEKTRVAMYYTTPVYQVNIW